VERGRIIEAGRQTVASAIGSTIARLDNWVDYKFGRGAALGLTKDATREIRTWTNQVDRFAADDPAGYMEACRMERSDPEKQRMLDRYAEDAGVIPAPETL
jgi:hypothetical protein